MSKERAKGTAYENAVKQYICLQGLVAWRTEFSSPHGDLEVEDLPMVLECKNQRELRLAFWMDQVERSAARLAELGKRYLPAIIHKRTLRNVSQSYVTMPLYAFTELMEAYIQYRTREDEAND